MGPKTTFSTVAEPTDRESPTEDEIFAQLERILASPAFPASERRGSLLRYLVDETLAGRGNLLKGYAIATAVLDRDDGFDPQTDPVVRMEARRLRQDLDSYYVYAGSQDRVRISIPKGGYVPSFDLRGIEAGPASAAILHEVEDNPIDQSSPDKTPGGPESGRPVVGFWTRSATRWVVAAVFAVIVLGYFLWTRQGSVDDAKAVAGHGTSLIVMPFEGIGGNADDSNLASGLTEEVISNLMRFADLRLYSIPATFQQNPTADPATVGHETGVDYVVSGSVRTDGNTVRVGAQLVDVGTGEILWTTIYDRDRFPGDLFELQRDLSASIASELGQPYGVIKTNVIDRISKVANPSMPSYDCVLRAYAYRRTFSEDLYGPTLDCLKAATQRDPDYAEAWALLGCHVSRHSSIRLRSS